MPIVIIHLWLWSGIQMNTINERSLTIHFI